MLNTTGTLRGDLEAQYGPAREAWLHVPLFARIPFAVLSATLCLCALGVCAFAAWQVALWIFNSQEIQSLATEGSMMAFWLRWLLTTSVGVGTFAFCAFKAQFAMEWLHWRTASWLTRHFS